MGIVDNLTKQHEQILEIAGEISNGLQLDSLQNDASSTATLLSKLAGVISIHLGVEDDLFYPKLLASEDESVRNTAQNFIDEMGQISAAFEAYRNKWMIPSKIQSEAAAFIEETNALFGALANRIERENTELFVLAAE